MWDYGPLGVELKNNVKRAWWRAMVQERDDIVGLDAGILMPPQVWVTSGHVGSFTDPLVECKTDHLRFRLECALAVAIAFGAGSAQAQTVELKLSHFVPPQHAFHKWVVAWAKKIEKESKGRLKFTIYPNGQLVGPPNRQFDAARNGITDIACVLHGVTPGRYPMTELANLPFTWPSAGADLPVMAKRMTELAPKYLAAEHTGLHILFMTMANPIVIYSKVPINTLADFKGMKIRYASITNKQLLDALGAAPLLIPPPEAQDALAKGIVEGAMFPHEAGLAYDLASVVKYAIEPPMASATFAMVDESGEVQFAAAEPARHPRQGDRRRPAR